MFLLFLIFLIRNFLKEVSFNKLFHYSLLILLVSVLFLGLFDHFLWTLQQGQLMFWLTLGLVGFLTSKVEEDYNWQRGGNKKVPIA